MSTFGLAIQRQWTPSAQLALESLKGAGQMAASMDKKSEVKYERDGSSGPSGIGGLVGTVGGGIIGSFIPGIGTAAGMIGGGTVGGAIDGGLNGNIGAGVGQGLGMGMAGASVPGMFGAEGWGELLGQGAAQAAEAGASGATSSLLAQTAPSVGGSALENPGMNYFQSRGLRW